MASAALPTLAPTAVGAEPDDADFDSAVLVDADRRRWRVRAPRHLEASTRLETERQVLRAFSAGVRAELPFLIPTVAGTVRIGNLTVFVYSHLAGRNQSVEQLSSGGDRVAQQIGRAMAAIHDLSPDLVQGADLPVYSANEFRQRRLNELDQAATTGKIPSSLLRRWEHALEDVTLWRFSSCVVHGDLHEDNLLMQESELIAVTGWTDLRVGDPADDFAWLTALEDRQFVEAVQESYTTARRETPDPHLLRRAALCAEFALAQWLVRGVVADDARMVTEAQEMLASLERDIAEYGGQPISLEEPVLPAQNNDSVQNSDQPTPVKVTNLDSSGSEVPVVAPDQGAAAPGSEQPERISAQKAAPCTDPSGKSA